MPEVVRELADHIRELAEAREVTWFNDEEKSALRRCLQKLPDKSRRLIILHYDLDVTSVEIARQMEINAARSVVRCSASANCCASASSDYCVNDPHEQS